MLWLWLVLAIFLGTNMLGGLATENTVEMMRSVSEFATRARQHDLDCILTYNALAYPTVMSIAWVYLTPLRHFLRSPQREPASDSVRRRALAAPTVLSLMSFSAWAVSIVYFPAMTISKFGHWSIDLMSQQILSPLVNGFLAATTSFFLVDMVFRALVIPKVFPDGRLNVSSRAALGLRSRLLLYLIAVVFLPLFTMLGIARGAGARLEAGLSVQAVIPLLNDASSATFGIYLLHATLLTVVLSQSLTRPLRAVTRALDRIEANDLAVVMRPTANDEVGLVEQGVNRMVATLRDREQILQTFGRVVEPAVRDRLLRGDVPRRGEMREATVFFCDMRGFTEMAEHSSPHDVVATLNEFFSAMTDRVREHGGFVDKFIGDAILVVFGLFDESGDRGAAAAVRCAGSIRDALALVNRERSRRGQPWLALAGTIHTGTMVAGTIGAQDRHEFTVVGDTVNVAARLQETCKQRDWQFLASSTTVDLARAAGVSVNSVDEAAVNLRGRREPVHVYRLG